MILSRLYSGVLLVLVCGLVATTTAGADPDQDALRRRVETLTDPALAGRAAGATRSAGTADTLVAWFEEAGLTPGFGATWQQTFPLHGEGWTGDALNGSYGRNIAGRMAGRGDLSERWIVVGAHHDHLGRVDPAGGDALPAAGDYYPGANDNASGVAIVQELARLAVREGDDTAARRSILFVHFDGEEVGLQGSAYFVDHLPVPREAIDAMVNLDTVGRLLDGQLFVSGLGTAAAFPDLVAAANSDGLPLSLARAGWSGSDHMIFNTREVPVLFLFGGPYPEYNRPGDVAEGLDYPAMAVVTSFADRLLDGLRRERGDLAWVMVGDGGLRGTEEAEPVAQNRMTWLGTLPDFSDEIPGYKLAGVFDGSPASRAGLEKGDVLVRLGGREINDLQTFTRALRAQDPGAVVEVEVRRAGRPLRFTVVLGNRSERE